MFHFSPALSHTSQSSDTGMGSEDLLFPIEEVIDKVIAEKNPKPGMRIHNSNIVCNHVASDNGH